MSQSITQKYLEALTLLNTWVTVLEWASKVAELYPEILIKAEQEASAQKNETTGMREIAARISSNISRGAYAGKIEIDNSDRPRKVRYLNKEDQISHEKNDIYEDLSPLTRYQKIKQDESELSTKDKYRIAELETIITQLRTFFNLDFEFEHAQAILNPTNPGKHHPDNIQLLLKSHNRMKSSNNWKRFTFEEQVEYIKAAVSLQKLVSSRMEIQLEEEVISQLIQRLKSIY